MTPYTTTTRGPDGIPHPIALGTSRQINQGFAANDGYAATHSKRLNPQALAAVNKKEKAFASWLAKYHPEKIKA